MVRRGEGFIMMSVDEAEKARRLADPARVVRPRMSRLQKGILLFLEAHGPTPYRIVRQALVGHDKPITPSFKASFSRSVGGLLTKRFVIPTHEPTGMCLARHPDWAAFMETLKGRGR
jgi:hypothetical protein